MKYSYLTGNTDIIALHRVLHDKDLENKLLAIPSMELAASKLREFIIELRSEGYQFVSLDDVIKSEAPSGAKRIALTFDDGYIDFYEVILPILEELQVPACLYLVTGYPDDTCYHSFGILEDFVNHAESAEFYWEGKHYHYRCDTQTNKKSTLLGLDAFIESKINGVSNIKDIFEAMGVSSQLIEKSRAVDWAKTRELHQHPLITIGSHTVSHPRLTELSSEDAANEINNSKKRLEEQLNTTVDHFSFPYGDHDETISNLVKQAGYLSATTIESGSYSADNKYKINRHWLDSYLQPISA